jgi:hypothetical protein
MHETIQVGYHEGVEYASSDKGEQLKYAQIDEHILSSWLFVFHRVFFRFWNLIRKHALTLNRF